MQANKKFLFGSPPVRSKNKPRAQGRGLRENSLAE
jgi:hypothetical protein